MRYETQTVRIGEELGPVDWDHATLKADPERAARFREMADALDAGKEVLVTTDGGWPKIGYRRLIRVAMYDGWPYWAPHPSFFKEGALGPEWHSFKSMTDFRIVDPAERGGEETT